MKGKLFFTKVEKLAITIVISGIILPTLLSGCSKANKPCEYPIAAKTEFVGEKGTFVLDYQNNLWEIKNNETFSYSEGDYVAMIMNDNGTPDDITDDRIICHQYAGHDKYYAQYGNGK